MAEIDRRLAVALAVTVAVGGLGLVANEKFKENQVNGETIIYCGPNNKPNTVRRSVNLKKNDHLYIGGSTNPLDYYQESTVFTPDGNGGLSILNESAYTIEAPDTQAEIKTGEVVRRSSKDYLIEDRGIYYEVKSGLPSGATTTWVAVYASCSPIKQ